MNQSYNWKLYCSFGQMIQTIEALMVISCWHYHLLESLQLAPFYPLFRHLFAIGSSAFDDMNKSGKNQAIVIR